MSEFKLGVKYKPFAKYIENGEYARMFGMKADNAFIQMLSKVSYFIITEKKQYSAEGRVMVRRMTVGFGERGFNAVEGEFTFGFSKEDDFLPILTDYHRPQFRAVRERKPKCAAEETAKLVRERMEQHEAEQKNVIVQINEMIKHLDNGVLTINLGDGQYHNVESVEQLVLRLNTVLRDKLTHKRDQFRSEAQKNAAQAEALDKILESI